MQHLPPHMAAKISQLQQRLLEAQRTKHPVASLPVSDKELLDRVNSQWTPSLSALNYFQVEVHPRNPLTAELTHYPSRSRYYETFLCTWTFAFSILLIYSLEYALLRRAWARAFARDERRVTILQFILLVVPFQICVLDFPVKSYANFVLPFNAACLLFYLCCLLHKRLVGPSQSDVSATELPTAEGAYCQIVLQLPLTSRKPQFNDLLSIYRSIVYISTAVCIFARDQPCWNNDFSKTYSFGTGLMDVGIGCFIICVGSLGPTAMRRVETVDRPLALRKAALQAGILTACGLVKTLIVVSTAKVQGITFDNSWREYGMHWNAFYSLAVARILGTVIELLILPKRMPPLLAAAVVAAAHEIALSPGGLAELVMAPGMQEPHNRSNLIGQNREGLASVPGLLALYLAGLQLGRWARDWTAGDTAASVKILGLLICSLALRPIMIASGSRILPESRRLLNPSYCAWVLAFSCFCILFASIILAARRRLLPTPPVQTARADGGGIPEGLTPLHLRQVDSSGLLYFLISNLLTGAFNFLLDRASPNRERTDGPVCFCVILLYTGAAFGATRLAATKLSFRVLQDKLMGLFFRAGQPDEHCRN